MLSEWFKLPRKLDSDSTAQSSVFPIQHFLHLRPITDKILHNPAKLTKAICAKLVEEGFCLVRADHLLFDTLSTVGWIISAIAKEIYEETCNQIKGDIPSFPRYPFERCPTRSFFVPLPPDCFN